MTHSVVESFMCTEAQNSLIAKVRGTHFFTRVAKKKKDKKKQYKIPILLCKIT